MAEVIVDHKIVHCPKNILNLRQKTEPITG